MIIIIIINIKSSGIHNGIFVRSWKGLLKLERNELDWNFFFCIKSISFVFYYLYNLSWDFIWGLFCCFVKWLLVVGSSISFEIVFVSVCIIIIVCFCCKRPFHQSTIRYSFCVFDDDNSNTWRNSFKDKFFFFLSLLTSILTT